MDGEPAPEQLAELLGAVKAAQQITRSIAGTERELRRRERRKDELRANLRDTTGADANRLKERIDEIQDRIDQLSKQRQALTDNLATLTQKLAT
jgi:chromosome segregation ATPase